MILDGLRAVLAVGLVGAHELVADADGVVGVLEEDGGERFGVRAGAVVAVANKRVSLGLFLRLALDEVDDVRMLDVQDRHLGRATCLAAALDDAGEGIESAHEAEGPAGRAAAGHVLPGWSATS